MEKKFTMGYFNPFCFHAKRKDLGVQMFLEQEKYPVSLSVLFFLS